MYSPINFLTSSLSTLFPSLISRLDLDSAFLPGFGLRYIFIFHTPPSSHSLMVYNDIRFKLIAPRRFLMTTLIPCILHDQMFYDSSLCWSELPNIAFLDDHSLSNGMKCTKGNFWVFFTLAFVASNRTKNAKASIGLHWTPSGQVVMLQSLLDIMNNNDAHTTATVIVRALVTLSYWDPLKSLAFNMSVNHHLPMGTAPSYSQCYLKYSSPSLVFPSRKASWSPRGLNWHLQGTVLIYPLLSILGKGHVCSHFRIFMVYSKQCRIQQWSVVTLIILPRRIFRASCSYLIAPYWHLRASHSLRYSNIWRMTSNFRILRIVHKIQHTLLFLWQIKVSVLRLFSNHNFPWKNTPAER